jgi:hypothetical protein
VDVVCRRQGAPGGPAQTNYSNFLVDGPITLQMNTPTTTKWYAGSRKSEPGRPPLMRLLGTFLLLILVSTTPACAELELLKHGAGGGPGPPPSGSLSVSFIDVGQGDGVLVQAGGESYLIDAGRPEEGPNVVDFLRSRGVDSLDGIVVTNPRI